MTKEAVEGSETFHHQQDSQDQTRETSRSGGNVVLLTGATGFIGKVILTELLRRREELGVAKIQVLIRPRKGKTPQERFEQDLSTSPAFSNLQDGWMDHCKVVGGDLTLPGCGIDPAMMKELFEETTQIIHCAASVDFDRPVQEAARANIDASLQVLELARNCRPLINMVAVSTAYVTPHDGQEERIREELVSLPRPAGEYYAEIRAGSRSGAEMIEETGHPNTYTFTKCLAEHLLWERRGDVPLRIVRPSVVCASRRYPHPGWIDSPAAFAGYLIYVGMGYLQAFPGHPSCRLDVIACDDVVDRILAMSLEIKIKDELQSPTPPIVHAVTGREKATRMDLGTAAAQDFFSKFQVGASMPNLKHLGPEHHGYNKARWRYHTLPFLVKDTILRLRGDEKMRKGLQKLYGKVEYVNQAFTYFSNHTYDFETSMPLGRGFDPRRYMETVVRGIYLYLLRGREAEQIASELQSLGGSDLRSPAIRKKRAPGLSAESKAGEGRARKKVLITGATGFLGRHLLEAITDDQGFEPTLLVRDRARFLSAPWRENLLSVELIEGDLFQAQTLASEGRFDGIKTIYHLAGQVRHTRESSAEQYRVNVDGALEMVRVAARTGSRLVLVSEAGIVGCFHHDDVIGDEHAPYCEEICKKWPFFDSKIQMEKKAWALAEELGVEIVFLRTPMLFGPRDHNIGSTRPVLELLRGKIMALPDGRVNFADVRDVAPALMEAGRVPSPRPIYHTSGTALRISEVFSLISEASGAPAPRTDLPTLLLRNIYTVNHKLARWMEFSTPDPVLAEMASYCWRTESLWSHHELDYQARPPAETFRDTVAWLLEHFRSGDHPGDHQRTSSRNSRVAADALS